MSGRIIRQDFGGLTNLVKALDDKNVVRIGILASKTQRGEAGKLLKEGGHAKKSIKRGWGASVSNADIGAIQEFGSFSKGIPARSWLIMPLIHEHEQIVEDASTGIEEMVQTGNTKKLLKRVGIGGEAAIQRAFSSGGFGSWKPLKSATVARKRSSAILIDTAQLRRAVASEVGPPR